MFAENERIVRKLLGKETARTIKNPKQADVLILSNLLHEKSVVFFPFPNYIYLIPLCGTGPADVGQV
jgi:hypothetical protein